MRHGIKKPHSLTVTLYSARLFDLNEYLASFSDATLNDKIGVTKLNNTLLNIMPNRWSKKACIQGFYCEPITFKNDVDMFLAHGNIRVYLRRCSRTF